MLLLSASSSPELERAKEVFQKFDMDGSGAISSVELTTVCFSNVSISKPRSDEEAEALFRYLDGDGLEGTRDTVHDPSPHLQASTHREYSA
jgi:Ca2+-binding EF-hand superfamily protein